MKFKIGQIVITKGVNAKISKSIEFSKFILESIAKYRNCNWGNLGNEDQKMNDDAVKNGDDRIFAKYNNDEGDIYIITEWNREVTTILFPSEY